MIVCTLLGMITMLLMQLGEIVFGGGGILLFHCIIIMVLTTVFICGLMVEDTLHFIWAKQWLLTNGVMSLFSNVNHSLFSLVSNCHYLPFRF